MVDLSSNRDRAVRPAPAFPWGTGATLAAWILLGLLALALAASFWVVIPAGERGVWMRFGQVQDKILAEGLHFLIPLVDSVETPMRRVAKISVRCC